MPASRSGFAAGDGEGGSVLIVALGDGAGDVVSDGDAAVVVDWAVQAASPTATTEAAASQLARAA